MRSADALARLKRPIVGCEGMSFWLCQIMHRMLSNNCDVSANLQILILVAVFIFRFNNIASPRPVDK